MTVMRHGWVATHVENDTDSDIRSDVSRGFRDTHPSTRIVVHLTIRAVYELTKTILARGSNETAIENHPSRPQVSVKRCR